MRRGRKAALDGCLLILEVDEQPLLVSPYLGMLPQHGPCRLNILAGCIPGLLEHATLRQFRRQNRFSLLQPHVDLLRSVAGGELRISLDKFLLQKKRL